MKILILFTSLLLFGFMPKNNPSKPTDNTTLVEHIIKGSEEEFTLVQVLDADGSPKYYYRDINQFPCKSDYVCRMMRVRLYWDIFGHFLQYKVPEDDPLTKLNHKEFSDKDYRKLHNILNNPGSEMKFCKYENLTSEEAENTYHSVDGISSATIPQHDFEYINGAIKTTYVLWHLAYDEVPAKIQKMTYSALNIDPTNSDALKQTSEHFKVTTNTNHVDQLIEVINNGKVQELNTALQLMDKEKKMDKRLKQALISQLQSDDLLKKTIVFNYLQQMGESKAVRKTELDFFGIE